MDPSPIISTVLQLWWLIAILLILAVLKSPRFKGLRGEACVKLAARFWLPSETYYRIHNVMLPTPDGTTQIDHIFVSRFGIFVVETKNMKGWIFGGTDQAQWTQQIFKRSFKFQNPLRQNYKHVKALESALDVPPETIHSVVVFAGDSTFKSAMPPNVTTGAGYVTYIKSFQEQVLGESEIQRVVSQIRSGQLEPSRQTHREHVKRLKARGDRSAERKCPKCGSSMVLRTAKSGPNAGNKFWGCSAYPRCRVIQNVT